MRFNIKKISAVAISSLLTGMTMGVAAAASYPAPFVTGGVANTAIVYGTGQGVNALDQTYAASIQTDLQKYVSTSSSSTSTTVEGDVVALDSSSTRIWLNTSLNTATSTLTKSDLPVVLEETTFSGDVDAKLTSNIKIGGGDVAGGDNSDRVIFAKQPKSSSDPVIGISLGSSTYPLYNATVTMKAVNFTSSDSEGETIHLFGKDFVVSTATSTTDLVLFSSAKEVTLAVGGSSPAPSATVNIGGTDYVITLVSGSDTTATIDVDGESKEVTEGASKKIGGIDVAIKNVDESEAINTITASVLVGSEKITFVNGATVKKGSDDDPVDGTKVYLKGTPTALTELAVEVYKPDSSNDAVLAGEPFTDPVFGSFKVDFQGLSSPLDDADREKIEIQNSGDDDMSIKMVDSEENSATIIFAHNATSGANIKGKPANWRLANENNDSLFVYEGANLTEEDLIVLGNEDYGHILEVTQISNNTGTSYTDDDVKFQDKFSGETYETSFTSEGLGTVNIDGKSYTVHFLGDGDDGYATVKYPTGDASTTNTWIVYPTIETKNGAKVALYEPLNMSLSAWNGTVAASATVLKFPDGDGYTSATFTYAGMGNWTVTGAGAGLLSANQTLGANYTTLTIGKLTYNITSAGDHLYGNNTMIYVTNPEGTANIDQPAVIIFEGKDDNSAYEAMVVDLETAPAGSSDDGVGVNNVLFSTDYGHYSATLASNSDVTQDVDWYGTLVTTDAGESDQKTVEIAYPKSQAYAKIYVGEVSAVIGSEGGSSTGAVLVTDKEVSSVSSKDLVIVGGSCINAAAANVLGGAYCGAAFTAKTGVGSGQFLIKGVKDVYSSGKLALVVAGYEVADTANAVQYLTKVKPDTSKAYKGTSATAAQELVVTSA